ncbi:MAG TPA: 16S rRNA (guanine(527)-N(7))-methyltransferase RsmG [Micromonosporaceae bacterium]|nr:16S rRNA (guanine(527)-N(7))-methyltransferase RsmG [Micromonosporaceae bacterium]
MLDAEAPSSRFDAQPPADLRPAAERLFGANLAVAVRYAELLATEGTVRGLLGPRESSRVWDRHLLNCAAIAELVPPEARVVDVGSGAGLPGIPLAISRPDLSVVLLESLARRTAFLDEVVDALQLRQVRVVRGRAEEWLRGQHDPADVATARALAPLDRLAAWCLPLVVPGGRVLAIKGESAAEEVERHRPAIARLGGGAPSIRRCGVGLIDPPTTVVEIVRERGTAPLPGRARGRRR